VTEQARASVIINNFNYAKYLSACISSALSQTYGNTEVIVVDDGSNDGSHSIIDQFEDHITPVLKSNGGQASAFNAGFAHSRGEVVVFLDADDVLCPSAVETAIEIFEDSDVVKVQWPLSVIDKDGALTGRTMPAAADALPDGDLLDEVVRTGPANHVWPPTSGNAWSRSYLDQVLPMPEEAFRLGADNYLFELAPLFGIIRTVHAPQSCYRLHGENKWQQMSFDEKLRHELEFLDQYIPLLSAQCRRLKLGVNERKWRTESWWFRLRLAAEELDEVVPARTPFILVDGGSWGMSPDAKRQPVPLMERDGQFWGAPIDDHAAISELERLRMTGYEYIVIAWPAFWWLDYYEGFNEYLCRNFECVTRNDLLVIFRVNRGGDARVPNRAAEVHEVIEMNDAERNPI
jgi:glycosyltransferase involved in cell wall biosynthesis